MKYTIHYTAPQKKFIEIELLLKGINSEVIYLQLPAWRPGRYELQNYARNIQKFEVVDSNNDKVPFEKVSRERWAVKTKTDSIRVIYNCYAYQLDAGGCWIDEEQLYVNFIYCLIYAEGSEWKPCSVDLKVPSNFKIACSLAKQGQTLLAENYFHLSDSPCIASAKLNTISFSVLDYTFWITWIGENFLDWNNVKLQFAKFCLAQINIFGDLPYKEFHFLYEFLPYRQHHGVEHRNSTIITLGPAELLHCDPLYIDFLSISCHELFHAWNIAKIRPIELTPYDLTRENYFRSGFIVEGVTTYYGEYLLARSGVISQDQYFAELNLQFKKHFENSGNFNLSIADSSFDLWIDGYGSGIPNRKVSIYIKGAIIALILDLEIRKATHNNSSLDDVMRHLWIYYGKEGIGYTIKDYQNIIEQITKTSFENYFTECVFGTTDVKARLIAALEYIGCKLLMTESRLPLEKNYGMRTLVTKDGKTLVDTIEPGSPIDGILCKDDEIIAIDGTKVLGNANDLVAKKQEIEIALFRKNKLRTLPFKAVKQTYFNQFRIVKNFEAKAEAKENYQVWLKNNW